MTKQSKTIVFFGTDEFSAVTLKHLITAGYGIGAVVTMPDHKTGRGQKISQPVVKAIATSHNIPVFQPNKLVEIVDDIKNLAEPIGVLASFGKIIPKGVIDLFQPGIINIHPSLLPKYRGPTPVESAILNGDKQTGVTIMKLTAQMDGGPIYSQIKLGLMGDENTPDLERQLAEIGSVELIKQLPSIIDGSLRAVEQTSEHASYSRLLNKSDAVLNPEAVTASVAEKIVRAYLNYPKTRLNIGGYDIIVTEAHVNNADRDTLPPMQPPRSAKSPRVLKVRFKNDTYLYIDKLISPTGKLVSGSDFINGYLK